MNIKRVVVITRESTYAVGNLFVKALKVCGHEVASFDLEKVVSKYVRGGKIGGMINVFWPVDTWRRKGNRELAIFIQQFEPDFILISGDNPVQIGTLAFVRSILPDLKIILFWPDTLVNLTSDIINLHPMIDTVASYSSTAIEQFKSLGFKNCVWMPFAGDSGYLSDDAAERSAEKFSYDCSFIGGWRPERERVLHYIATSMPEISLKIVGPLWSKRVINKNLRQYIDDTPKFGKALGDFIRTSRINLNIIDNTNYPAANMRFFEIPVAGGLQLSSSCPEQDTQFLEGKHIFYYSTLESVGEKIKYILAHPDIADEVRKTALAYVKEHHTYVSRMKMII